MKFINGVDVLNKKVILRLDLNVTIENGNILDDTRIKKSIPTIKYLLSSGARILIMSHLGKVKTESDKENNSLRIVSKRLGELLESEIYFVDNIRSIELEKSLDEYPIVMMENTRFADLDGNKESGCDMELAKYWAGLGDIFVNDAFGTTHRQHASNYGISKFLPTYYGFLIKEELVGLDPVVNDIKKPFSVIMGGAKVDDKIKLIERLVQDCDYLIVGGGIANTFLKASGFNVGLSLYSVDMVEKIKDIIDKYKNKIYMPVDVIVKRDLENVEVDIRDIKTDDIIYDIGSKTISLYNNVVTASNTVLLNGTVGLYEKEEYRNGTEKLFQILSNINAIKIAGGGDAVSSVTMLGYEDSFDFLSTGGGATLDYIANKTLKCFEGEENDISS